MSWADWFPFVFFPLKIIVLGVGMFFSIKWHRDQAKEEERKKKNKTNRLTSWMDNPRRKIENGCRPSLRACPG